jgi:hypothetical protein
MRVVSCRQHQICRCDGVGDNIFLRGGYERCELAADRSTAGVVRIGRPVVLVGQERRAPAEEHRIGAAQQLGVVLVERLVRAVVLVEVVEESLERLVGRLVVAVQRLEVADNQLPHAGDGSWYPAPPAHRHLPESGYASSCPAAIARAWIHIGRPRGSGDPGGGWAVRRCC